jgi:putative tryptophan/tyrosine transport system substrate-binding protein
VLRRRFLAAALAGIATTLAAQPTRVARIAYLSPLSADSDKAFFAAFRQGLKEHGYVEGVNIVVDVRYASGKLERLPALATELARAKPALFVAYGPDAIAAAAKASNAPVVISNTQDPVASGLVPNLARPGGRITGMSDFHAASTTKRLEILKETLPGLKRLAIFWRRGNAPHGAQMQDLERIAPRLGLALLPLEIDKPEDIEPAFTTMQRERAGALLMLGESVLTANQKRIIALSLKSGIPSMYTSPLFAELGGMLSYGADIADLCRRSAGHVDKILKGARAGDLPIEQPTKFELAVNLGTAKKLGIAIPRAILLRADRVIE